MLVQLKSVKHISFDVWLTLIRSHQSFKPARNALFRSFFGISKPIEVVHKTMTYFDRLFNHINQITGKQVEWEEMILCILSHLEIDILTIDKANLAAYYTEMEAIFWKYPPILMFPALPKVLAAARQKDISLSLLSNTGFIEGATLRKYFAQQNIATFLDFQLYSDELQLSKPNPKAFEAVWGEVLKRKNVEKNQILHIGDNQIADSDAAYNYGFTGFHTEDSTHFLQELLLYAQK